MPSQRVQEVLSDWSEQEYYAQREHFEGTKAYVVTMSLEELFEQLELQGRLEKPLTVTKVVLVQLAMALGGLIILGLGCPVHVRLEIPIREVRPVVTVIVSTSIEETTRLNKAPSRSLGSSEVTAPQEEVVVLVLILLGRLTLMARCKDIRDTRLMTRQTLDVITEAGKTLARKIAIITMIGMIALGARVVATADDASLQAVAISRTEKVNSIRSLSLTGFFWLTKVDCSRLQNRLGKTQRVGHGN